MLCGQKRKAYTPNEPNARKKLKKAKSKPTPNLTPEILTKVLNEIKEPVVGIDLSLSSPGVAVVDPIRKILHCYVVRHRKGDIPNNHTLISEGPLAGWCLQITCFPEPQYAKNTACERFARFAPVIDAIMHAVGDARIVGIENYAFSVGRFQSSSQSILIELGGVLRWSLFRNIKKLVEISPCQVKRLFSGMGKATKEEMVHAALHTYKIPCLHKMLGINANRKHAVKPVDDAVDAIAVAFCTMLMFP